MVRGLDKGGPLNGVTWDDADAIVMPVGPHHAISISKKSSYRDLTEHEVVFLNRLQAQAAYKEIYFRPDSGLGDLVAEGFKKQG